MFSQAGANSPNSNEGTPEVRNLEAAQQHRQNVLKLALIVYILFLLLDGGNRQSASTSAPSNASSKSPSQNSSPATTTIPLNDAYGARLNRVLRQQPIVAPLTPYLNATGFYRGVWTANGPSVLSRDHGTNATHNTQRDGTRLGPAFLQLYSVPVHNIPDLTFVYGIVRFYRSESELANQKSSISRQNMPSLELGYPLQGILISSQEKLVLFSTPYKTQKLYLKLASSHFYNDSLQSHRSSGGDALLTNLKPSRRRYLLSGDEMFTNINRSKKTTGVLNSFKEKNTDTEHSKSWSNIFHRYTKWDVMSISQSRALSTLYNGADDVFSLPTLLESTAVIDDFEGVQFTEAAQRRLSNNKVSSNFSVSVMNISSPAVEVLLTTLTDSGFISAVIADHPPTAPPLFSRARSNETKGDSSSVNDSNSSTSDRFMLSVAIGEAMLPIRFKQAQQNPPQRIKLTVDRNNQSVTEVFRFTQTSSSLDCQYNMFLKGFSRQSSSISISGADKFEWPADSDQAAAAFRATDGNASHFADKISLHSDMLLREPISEIGGNIISTNCNKQFSFHADSFHIEMDRLTRKVEIYSLATTLVCVTQIFLVILQLKHSATQSQSSRVSMICVLYQSLLDAIICMFHLLLSFAIPSVFFASFVWIAILKLLLFSVFQMKFVISIYQARYAQEIVAEGWQGFRRRLLTLHVRFYGAVFVVLFFSMTFYTRPVITIFGLYSYWVPQIIYSAYSGTKHPFHIGYLIGISTLRCFLPLYYLGCPYNFLSLLSDYFNPYHMPPTTNSIAAGNASSATAVSSEMYSPTACYVLIIWQTTQVAILLLQTILGPRFFIPKQFLPQKYDYKRPIPPNVLSSLLASGGPIHSSSHVAESPPSDGRSQEEQRDGGAEDNGSVEVVERRNTGIRARINSLFGSNVSSNREVNSHLVASDSDDLETGRLLIPLTTMSTSGSGTSNPSRAEQHDEVECIVCYNPICLTRGSENYMITPCDHIFHDTCLTQWTNVKLECPVCRSALPTIE